MSENEGTGLRSNHDSPLEQLITRLLLRVLLVGMGFVVIMMLVTVVHAVGRYGFSEPIPGLVEMSSFMLVIIIFSSAAYTEMNGSHIVIGVLVDKFPQRVQAGLDCFMYILSLGLVVVTVWQTIKRGLFVEQIEYMSAVLHIPHYPFIYIAAFCWTLLGVAILIRLIHFVGRASGRITQ